MSSLKDLLGQMKGEMPPKGKKKSANEMVEESLPSDESLQSAKAGRRQTANEVTDYLASKGWPTAGALAGTAVDISADMIPESRGEYKEQLVGSMSPVGSVGKLGAAAKLGTKEAVPTLSSISPGLRQKLMGSAEELAAFHADPRAYVKATEVGDKVSRAEAQKILDLKKGIGISKNAKELDAPLQFEGEQAKETRRMLDPSRKFESMQKVADVESGTITSKAGPKASELIPDEQVIQDVKFREHEGPSVQQLKKEAGTTTSEREAMLRRLREKK